MQTQQAVFWSKKSMQLWFIIWEEAVKALNSLHLGWLLYLSGIQIKQVLLGYQLKFHPVLSDVDPWMLLWITSLFHNQQQAKPSFQFNLPLSPTATRHHSAVCEDSDWSNAQDMPLAKTWIWLSRWVLQVEAWARAHPHIGTALPRHTLVIKQGLEPEVPVRYAARLAKTHCCYWHWNVYRKLFRGISCWNFPIEHTDGW